MPIGIQILLSLLSAAWTLVAAAVALVIVLAVVTFLAYKFIQINRAFYKLLNK